MLEVAMNYRVVQNKRTPGSSFKFIAQQRFEIVKIIPEMFEISLSAVSSGSAPVLKWHKM